MNTTSPRLTDIDVKFDQASGQNVLVLTDASGAVTEHAFDIAPMDLVQKLDELSVGVEINDEQYRQLHIDTFTQIVDSIASLDDGPKAPKPFGRIITDEGETEATAAQIAERIGSITITVSHADNGWFPSPWLDSEHVESDEPGVGLVVDDSRYIDIPALDGPGLYPVLRELFGDYRYESCWRVTLRRDPAPSAVRKRDDR